MAFVFMCGIVPDILLIQEVGGDVVGEITIGAKKV